MPDKPKTQLTDEQRQELKAIVKSIIREKLARREELKDQAAVMREVWKALIESPRWSIVQSEKPADAPTTDEIWSMIPVVKTP